MTRVKICGITEVRFATAAIEAGADYIGIVFAPSPRQVSLERAREIASAANGSNTDIVGVFVNMPAAKVNKISVDYGLDRVQLSGDETWEYCLQIAKPVIKAVHVLPQWTETDVINHLCSGNKILGERPVIYLLDTHIENKYGGSGQAFNREIAKKAAAQFPVIIAGGLNPENVRSVVSKLNPWGVDVSSGVETNGIKDINKIKAFVSAVRYQGLKVRRI